jgi:glycosyltransferase involved in cell wall biosynthesis
MSAILAVIPAYNEAAHITQVVQQVRRFLPVLVVDDGSGDATARLAAEAGADVLRQIPNQGKGAALRAGFRKALSLGAPAAITLDGDGQHDPAEIPAFLAAYARRAPDLIIGARSFSAMPLSRRFANTTGRWLFSWALGRPIPDNQSGYRMVSRRLMETTLGSIERGFEFEVEMIAACIKSGYPLDWVPIRTIYTGAASHIHPLRHILNYLRIILATRRMMHTPLRQF